MRVFSGTGVSGDCELPHTAGGKHTSVLCKRRKLSPAGHLSSPSKALSGMWYPVYLPAHLFSICSCPYIVNSMKALLVLPTIYTLNYGMAV